MSRVAAALAACALALAGYAAFKPAPTTGDTSVLTIADQYVHDLAVQSGVTIENIQPLSVREHGNTAIVRERVTFHQSVYGIKLPSQSLVFVVRERRSGWDVRYVKQVG